MNFLIKEVNFSKAPPPKRYEIADVVYDDGGKESKTKIFSFANPSVFEFLKTVKPQTNVEVKLVKNGAYWNWASIEAAASAPPTTAAASGESAGANRVVRSNYETPEERARRQVLIVRQSSVTSAIAILTAGAKTPPKLEDVLNTAQEIVDFVFESENLVESAKLPDGEGDVPF